MRDVDKAGILEGIFEILLVQSSQKRDRHRSTGDFVSTDMSLYGGTEGNNELGELANVWSGRETGDFAGSAGYLARAIAEVVF